MQIINTLKCNFTCGHCLFTCGPRRREVLDNFTLQTFVEKFSSHHEFINYCGGEIFFNPDWDWQLQYLSNFPDYLRIVTNGSKFFTRGGNETRILKEFVDVLWDISGSCKIIVLISNDEFHRKIYWEKDLFPLEKVIKLFGDAVSDIPNVTLEVDNRDIRGDIAPLGRAFKNGCYTVNGEAMCRDFFEATLMPDGSVKGCCNGRMDVGTYRDSQSICEDVFERLEKPKNCLQCKYR